MNAHKLIHDEKKPFPCEICQIAIAYVGGTSKAGASTPSDSDKLEDISLKLKKKSPPAKKPNKQVYIFIYISFYSPRILVS